MSVEVKIPAIGESISEVTLASWLKADGESVNEGDILCEIESDKATVELPAPQSGVLKILVEDGTELKIGDKIGELLSLGEESRSVPNVKIEKINHENVLPPTPPLENLENTKNVKNYPSPSAAKILAEKGVEAQSIIGSGKDGRITKSDAVAVKGITLEKTQQKEKQETRKAIVGGRNRHSEKMTRLRKTIAKRLVLAKNSTAMLTTFNEVDMYEVMELRKRYKEAFLKKHDIGLGFMSIFTKAATLALREFPNINAQINDEEIIYHDYADVGIAVSTPRGLVVPVVRDAQNLSLADIEKEIKNLAIKARDGKLSIDEMEGGTFTITNGGVFGSMLSTPIINIPQSAILGMHNIVERAVVVKGEIKVRPVMYIALSYDHRIIDGRESVSFLKAVKDMIEDPARMLLDL